MTEPTTAASDVPDLGKPFCTRCHKWGHRYTECPDPTATAAAWPEDCVLAVPPHTLTDPVSWGGRSACRTCAAAAEDLHRSLDEIAEAERRAWETSRDIFIR